YRGNHFWAHLQRITRDSSWMCRSTEIENVVGGDGGVFLDFSRSRDFRARRCMTIADDGHSDANCDVAQISSSAVARSTASKSGVSPAGSGPRAVVATRT